MAFKKGDLVISTKLALTNGLFKKRIEGIIASDQRANSQVRVRKANQKSASYYHIKFWELDQRVSCSSQRIDTPIDYNLLNYLEGLPDE